MKTFKFDRSSIRSLDVSGAPPGMLTIEIELPVSVDWYGNDVESVEVACRDHVVPGVDTDLAAVRARFRLAQLAGTDAVDAGNGWNPAKIAALTRSWNDVAALADEVARLRREAAQR